MKYLSLLSLLFISLFAQADEELLRADEAFKLKAKVVNNEIILDFEIAKGYYLYKEKIKISTDFSEQLGEPKLPPAKIKNDEFFGLVGTYRKNTVVSIPIIKKTKKSILLTVQYQGCADLGVCYPPITKNIALDINNANAIMPKSNMLNLAMQTKSKDKNFEKIKPISDEPLTPDKAFKLSVNAINADTLLAVWDVEDNYYLYHNKFFIDIKGADFNDVNFPKGEVKDDPLFGKVEVHKHKLELEIPLKNIKFQDVIFTAKYQGCWEGGVCYPPQEKTFTIKLDNTFAIKLDNTFAIKSNNPVNTTNLDISIIDNSQMPVVQTVPVVPTTELNETDKITSLLQQDGILFILLSFFGFGLLLSLTPCVFPMIPILSGIIVGQKEKVSTKRALIMSIVFVLAMSFTYSIAGILAGYFGQNLQAMFQNPWVLTTFSLIFVALAFSMFGYFDIQLPSSLQNKITSISNKQHGGNLIGVVIMGFLSALIVGPCVAPPLAGALIYIGQTGDAALGGMSLFTMSLGMGVPLIIIGAGVSKLPKSGNWMNNVKHIFGILMLAVAIFLLDRIIPPLVSLILWASLLTIAPIAMGTFNSITNTSNSWGRIFKAIGLIIIGYGILIWILVARGGGDMFAPLAGFNTASTQATKTHLQFEKIKSIADVDKVLIRAKNNNQIVMMDFYADWCISCKELERFVFSNANVVKTMKDVINIQADVTANDDFDKELMAKFNIVGPPAILFFKNGNELLSKRIVGEINAQDFINHFSAITDNIVVKQ